MSNQLQKTIKKSLSFFRIQDKTLQEKEENINEKIERLKKALYLVVDNYYERVYLILEEIIKLRRKQMKKYNINNLANEKGIGLTYNQLTYVYVYKYISKETHEKIKKGKLKLRTVLFIINQDVRFKEPRVQNEVIEMYLNGEITTEEISRLKHELIFDKKKFDEKVVKADRHAIKMIYKIKGVARESLNNKMFFSNHKIFNQLCRETEKLRSILIKVKKENNRLKGGKKQDE